MKSSALDMMRDTMLLYGGKTVETNVFETA